MRSGFCARDQDHLTHHRCRLDGCSCEGHDADLLAKSAALLDSPSEDEGVDVYSFTLPLEMRDAVWDLMDASKKLTESCTEITMTAEQAMRFLYAIREGLSEIRDVEAALVKHIYTTGEHGDVRIEGLPPAKVTRSRDRKEWDAHGMARAVVDARMAAIDGEQPDPQEVAGWVLEALGISYGRVTVLRSLGLEPEDYCTSSPGRLSVSFAH